MDLDDLRALLSVIEHGSAQAAAQATRTSRTTLRRRLENLEAQVGVPLLVRGTSGAVPTPAGLALAARGRPLVEEASAILRSVRELEAEPEGQLRALLPAGLPPWLSGLLFMMARERVPRLEFRATIADDPLSVLRDDVDLVLHFGAAPTRGPWVSTSLISTPERLVASPALLEERGTPTTLEDLLKLPLMSWMPPGEDGRLWPLKQGGGFAVSPMLVSSDVHLVRSFAAAGHGVALLPDADLPDPEGWALVPVMTDLVGRPCALRALVPEAMARLPKGRAILDLIRELLHSLSAAR